MSAILLLSALVLAPLIGGGFGELTCAILEILVFAAIIVYLVRDREQGWSQAPGLRALVVFFVLACVSVFLTESIYASIRGMIYLAASIGAYALSATLLKDVKPAAIAVWAITIVGLGICLFAIRDYAYTTGGGVRFWQSLLSPSEQWRLFGTFVNPGFFAGFLVVTIPVALAVFLVTRRYLLALAAGMAVVLQTLALMLTGTKFGIVAAVATLLVLFTLSIASGSLKHARFKRLIVIGLVLAPLLVIFSGPVRYRIQEAESGGSQVHSTEFRIYVWRSTVDMITAHPLLGTGPGTFEIAYPRYAIGGPTKYAHQSLLQIAAESGIPALVAFVVGLIAVGYASLRGIMRKEPSVAQRGAGEEEPPGQAITWRDLVPFSGWRMINCAVFAALVGSFFRNLVDSDWFVMGIALPFCVLTGLLAAQSGASKVSLKPGRGLRIGLVALCSAMILITTSFGLGDLLAPGDMQAGSPEKMLEGYESATKVSPLNPRYHRELAKYLAVSGDWSRARSESDLAIRLSPCESSGYQAAAAIAAAQGRYGDATRLYGTALRYNPNSTQTLYDMALAQRADGDSVGFEQSLKRLLSIEQSEYERVKGVPELVDLTYVQAHLYFGDKYYAQRQYVDAALEYEALADRLERWRRNKDIRKMQVMTGMITRAQEREYIELLRECYRRLADAYDKSGDGAHADDARRRLAEMKSPA